MRQQDDAIPNTEKRIVSKHGQAFERLAAERDAARAEVEELKQECDNLRAQELWSRTRADEEWNAKTALQREVARLRDVLMQARIFVPSGKIELTARIDDYLARPAMYTRCRHCGYTYGNHFARDGYSVCPAEDGLSGSDVRFEAVDAALVVEKV